METFDSTLRVPEDHLLTDHTHDGGLKDKLYHVKSAMRSRVTTMRSTMSSNPTKWAGIAAGAGLGLGIAGRILRNRSRAMTIPHVVIIEGSC